MEVIETEDYGVANTIDNTIYLHPKLSEFPKLREKILKHEFEHIKSKSFWKNRKIDALTELTFKDLYPFYKKYPKTFLKQNLPISYSKTNNTLLIEWTLLFLYTFYVSLGVGIYYLIKIFSPDKIIFWRIIKLSSILILIVIAGHYLIKLINKNAND